MQSQKILHAVLSRPVEILLVEDNTGDVALMYDAFYHARMAFELRVVRNGEEALEYLRCKGRYVKAPRPDMILLDLNLPKLDGRDLLVTIKDDDNLKDIPVLVISNSGLQSDVVGSYQANANGYILKPEDISEFGHMVQMIERFWFEVAYLPSS